MVDNEDIVRRREEAEACCVNETVLAALQPVNRSIPKEEEEQQAE
jgi:hypothetical protein